MNALDGFLRLAAQLKAERLTLASGHKALLVTGSGVRPLTPLPLTHEQVTELIGGLMGGNGGPALLPGQTRSITYDSPAGSFQAKIAVGHDGAVQVDMIPTPADAAHAASTPAHPDTAALPGAPAPPEKGAAALRPAAAGRAHAAAAPHAGPSTAPAAGGVADTDMQTLLWRLVNEGCSDLHLTTACPPMFRKDGAMAALGGNEPIGAARMKEMLYSLTSAHDIERFEKSRDVDFAYEIPNLARFRCNLFEDRRGLGGVFRVIPSKIPTVEDLMLPKAIVDLTQYKKGLVLVTGPTGSGKSTTLAALIGHINRTRHDHIITIEDPIEFVHENRSCLVRQREVGRHTSSFKAALRAALREDPDIVLVGEMRDLETMAIAIETAETGHLVFGTLHTNTAASTVDRIVDQFPADRHEQVRVMLSESLRGVVTQTLCRKKGGGRIAAQEILLVNPAVSNLIREGKTFQIASVMQTGKSLGMACMNDALMDLVKRNLVEPAEAYHHSVGKAEFRSMLEKAGMKAEAVKA